MNKENYKSTLLENIMGWAEGLFVILFFIFLKEYGKGTLDIEAFMQIQLSLYEGGKFLALFFLWKSVFYFTKTSSLNAIKNQTRSELTSKVFVCVTMGALVVTLFADLFGIHHPKFSFFLFFWGILLVLFVVQRIFLATLLHWSRQLRQPDELHHAVIIGVKNVRSISLATNLTRPNSGYSFLGFIDDIEDEDLQRDEHIKGEEELEELKKYLKEALPIVSSLQDFETYISENRLDEVFITLPIRSFYDELSRIIKLCNNQGVKICLVNDLFDLRESAKPELQKESTVTQKNSAAIPNYIESDLSSFLINYDSIKRTGIQQDCKRLFDIIASLSALILLAPVFLAVAVVIYLNDGFPILFIQKRVGLNKRRFNMFKFRSM
ncbi:MAG: hypothetical protein D3923_07655, partial [Candidatus Electrothrix sp. AR3]|nr:hypothetical protein [Candidatus Electrothrix sp. AR3]